MAPLASGVYSDVLAINANSKHIPECKKLFEFLLTPEAQAKLLEFELLPIRKDVDISSANPVLTDVIKGHQRRRRERILSELFRLRH